jgi:hypothetical protein
MNQISCLLSTAYWPPIQYLAACIQYSKINIEYWETYTKQSYRNRCQIYGPNGIQLLIVPVEKGSFHKVLIKDLKITYDTHWQKNHLKSMEAAYRSSPFYEYYFDDILPIYKKKHTYLLDLNHEILNLTFNWLKINVKVDKTILYEPTGNFMDFRNEIHPKIKATTIINQLQQPSYVQGFEQRHGFIPNLSIIDLVFNVGPESISFVQKVMSTY